jgi:single-strand DNA-binding protein
MVNRATLIGYLGKDPEIRRFENGTSVGKFSLATSDNVKDPTTGEWVSQTEWHEIVAWRGNAEYAEKFLKKGSLVFIEGKITHRKYADKNGVDRYITEVVAYTLRGLEKRESSSNYFPSQEPASLANRTQQVPVTTTAPPSELPKPVDFDTTPTHEMADAPSADMSGDLPF